MLNTNKKLKKYLQKRMNYLHQQMDITNFEALNNILNEVETIKELAQENNITLEVL